MDAVYNELVEIVGEDYVSNRPEDLFTYSKDLGTSPPLFPDYVAAPKDADQVSRIVRMANRQKVPVVPLGGGMSLAGLALPLQGGIALDLKRMDRIIELNEKARFVVVEAGASHGKLTAYLHKHAPHLMHSEPGAPPAATIGGNIAIHGQGDLAHPYGFNSDMINGLEVVLPTGEICKFGSCAIGSGWYTLHPLPDIGLLGGSEESPARIRARQAHATGARILATACPNCLIMLEDAVKVEGLEQELKVMDVCEIVNEMLDQTHD